MKPESLSQVVAILTGAAGGLGSAMVEALVQGGARVLAVDIDEAALAALAARLPEGRVEPHAADIRDAEACAAIVARAIRYYGRETVNGEDLTAFDARSEELRQLRGAEIAMIFQEPMTSLDPLFTVGDQIMEAILYHQEVSKAEARKIAIEMLDKVRMPQPADVIKQYPHQLSGGMRQRVMIAMALSCRPQLLIADEPTTALDVTTEAQILELMRELQDELGMAILFITHDLGVIAEMAEEVAVMYLGKVVEQSDIQSLFTDPQHPYTRALMQSIPKIGQKAAGRLEAIRGMVPSPRDIPSGCPFHPRCASFIADVCNVKTPRLQETKPGHAVSCFLYNDGGGINGA